MATTHAFGPFRLDADAEILFRGSDPLPIGKRAVAVLRVLVDRAGAPVSKDALIDAAWSGLVVEESNLTVQIAALRRVLGVAPGGGKWIETLPRRGYRFVGPVTKSALGTAVDVPGSASASGPSATAHPEDVVHGPRRIEPERRQLTILSCKLLLPARAALDPEDLRVIIKNYHQWVADTVDRFNGSIGSRGGTTVLAYFGYPAAHEDDAEQAVQAGLRLCTAVESLASNENVQLRRRVGIATGLVIAGEQGELGDAATRAVVGEAPSVAERLQALGQPGTVTIDGKTRRLIGNLFQCRDLATVDGETDEAFQVLGSSQVESRFNALRGTALTPFVGRDEELELVLRRWVEAKQGRGRVVVVTGEPGIGKSRLMRAVQDRLAAELHGPLIYQCSPHHQDSALYPVISQLLRAADIGREDIVNTRIDKLAALLTKSGGSKDDEMALLAALLSIPVGDRFPVPLLTPGQLKERTLGALTAWLYRLCGRQPMLMLVEDLHWIDPTSLELLTRIVEQADGIRLLLLATARPEFEAPWPNHRHVANVTLNRLDRTEGQALITGVSRGKALPSQVLDQIMMHTDGVPLFIEELTKTVLESDLLRETTDRYEVIGPLPALAIPTTLHASLLARLDRLATGKNVAQIGATIGRVFSYELVAAVSGLPEKDLTGALGQLIDAELVFQRGAWPHANYQFKHALVQDAAYGTLLREPRRALHARITETLESQFPEIAESQPELLAHHCTEAGLIEKAAAMWGKAGQRSLERSALFEAAQQLRRALAQIPVLPVTPALRREQIKLQVGLVNALMHVKGYADPETMAAGERARLLIEEAEAVGEPPEDPLLLFSVLFGIWVRSIWALTGNVHCQLAVQLLELAEKQRATVPLMIAHRVMGVTLVHTGEIAQGRAHLDRALALYDPAAHRPLAMRFGQDIRVAVLAYRSWAQWFLGYPEAALADKDAALKEARIIGQAATLMFAPNFTLYTSLWCGDYASANMQCNQLVALAEEKGAFAWKALGKLHRGCLWALTGHASDAVQAITSAITTLRSSGATAMMPWYLSCLARAYAELGQFDDAWRYSDEAMTTTKTTKERQCEAEVYRMAGEIALLSPRPDAPKAEVHFERAIVIAREQHAKSWELRATMSMARLWRDEGKLRQAHDILDPIYSWFTEGFDTLDLKEARALLDELAQ